MNAACTLCGVKSTPDARHNFDALRIRNGTSRDLFFCENCSGVLRVALDRTFEMAGEPPPSWSVACAFAFHLGQYEDAARALQWDVPQPTHHLARERANWRSAAFTAPETKGRYGWGRWSKVRRDSERRPWDLLYETDQVDAAAYVMTGVHVGGSIYVMRAGAEIRAGDRLTLRASDGAVVPATVADQLIGIAQTGARAGDTVNVIRG